MKWTINRSIYCLFLATSLPLISSFQASFSRVKNKESVKISLKTSQFLKNIVILQEQYLKNIDSELSDLIHKVMQLNLQIYKNSEITQKDMQILFAIMDGVKKRVNEVKGLQGCNSDDEQFVLMWNYLEQSLKFVQLRGHEKDFIWLREQILQNKVVSAVATCIDLMQHFNGMMVTDYDLLVLGNIAVALLCRC